MLAWTDAIRDAELLGVLDIVPASRTVLVKLAGPRYLAPTRQRLSKLHIAAEEGTDVTAPTDADVDVQIDVVYDGPDLEEVARLTGLTVRAGGGRTHRHPVAGRIRRIRTGFRIPGRRRLPARGAATVRTADEGSRRVRRARG